MVVMILYQQSQLGFVGNGCPLIGEIPPDTSAVRHAAAGLEADSGSSLQRAPRPSPKRKQAREGDSRESRSRGKDLNLHESTSAQAKTDIPARSG